MQEYKFTPSQLNKYVNELFKENVILSNVTVVGEISGYALRNQHRYFTVKDSEGAIDCALFAFQSKNLKFEPKNGDKVIATGNVGIYEKTGRFQLYVRKLEQEGKGDLYLKFEKLKAQLLEEGLFDSEHKKSLPMLPRRIGVVTSHEGAAIRDILRTITLKYENADILIYPAVVQGEGAHKTVIEGIKYLDAKEDVDVIIIGRGGGSIEDLWAFNEEELARAIFAADTPIISAVGHESDFTISDFVADVRAATPTAAADMCVPSKADWMNWVGEQKINLNRAAKQMIERKRDKAELMKNALLRFNPINQIQQQRQTVDNKMVGMSNARFCSGTSPLWTDTLCSYLV